MIVKGCGWRPADNKRQPGWEKLRQRLVGEEGKPMLYVLETCDDFIRTIPILQHDDTNPEDLDTEAEDHVADEVRYAVMSRPWAPKHVAPQGLVLPKLPGEYTINELIARRRARRISAERMEN
jgi:hypothetical protein